MTETVVTTTKSKLASKTNITAALLLVFSVLNMLGVLPATFDATSAVNALVGIGSAAIIFFRTYATQLLRKPTTTQ